MVPYSSLLAPTILETDWIALASARYALDKESRNQEISSLLRFMKMVYADSASLNLQNCIRYQEPLPVSWI